MNYLLSNKISQKRLAMGLSQEALARLVAVSVTTIRSWERGAKEPTLGNGFLLARVLKSGIEDLYPGILGTGENRV